MLKFFNFISFVIASLLQESIFVAILTSVERIRNCGAFRSLFLDGAQAIKNNFYSSFAAKQEENEDTSIERQEESAKIFSAQVPNCDAI